jgi:chloramphenicol 3-O-phosphotransferase
MTTISAAGHLLERARWAARAYADYDQAAVSAVVAAVADAAYAESERFATAAVAETGMGVVADKVVKNRAASSSTTAARISSPRASIRPEKSSRSLVPQVSCSR